MILSVYHQCYFIRYKRRNTNSFVLFITLSSKYILTDEWYKMSFHLLWNDWRLSPEVFKIIIILAIKGEKSLFHNVGPKPHMGVELI